MSGPVIGGPGAALTLASRLAQADEELASASVSVSTEPHLDPVLASLIALVLGAAVQTTSCESGGGTGGGGAFERRSPPVPYWDGTADVARAAARLLARLVRCSQRSDRLCVANFAVRDGAGVRRICALAAALHGLGGPRAATPRACILCAIDSLTGPPPWCRRHANPGRRRLGPRCHCASQIGSRWLRHGRPGARERRCRCCAPHKCKHARATQRFGGMNALDAILKKRAVEERLDAIMDLLDKLSATADSSVTIVPIAAMFVGEPGQEFCVGGTRSIAFGRASATCLIDRATGERRCAP